MEISEDGPDIPESITVQHSVKELQGLIETTWNTLYRRDHETEDIRIGVQGLFCQEYEWLDPLQEVGAYFGDERYHPLVMQDAILLYAQGSTFPLDDTHNEPGSVQLPPEEEEHNTHDVHPQAEIVPAPLPPQQRNVHVGVEEQDTVERARMSDQKPLFWISLLACLWTVDSKRAKYTMRAGNITIFVLMLAYIVYLVRNPTHIRHWWWSNSGKALGHSYYVTEGLYFFLMYIVALRLFSLRHMESIFESTPSTILGLNNKWPEISWFVTKCALGGILVILLPAVVLVHGMIVTDCKHSLSNEAKELVNTTVPVEFAAYFLFSLITLPVFLYVFMLVKIHTSALDIYSDWLLHCTSPLHTAQAEFRKIQRRLKDSFDALHWVLSIIFLLLLIWISVSMWHTVYRWELEYHPKLFGVNTTRSTLTGCPVPPVASRSTLITVTQLGYFYFFPLYFISQIPQTIRQLIGAVHILPCQDEFLISSEQIKQQIVGVLQSGLNFEPRFTIFRRIPISYLSTFFLLVVTPLLTIIWTTVIHVTHNY